jgi:hypothetical protein
VDSRSARSIVCTSISSYLPHPLLVIVTAHPRPHLNHSLSHNVEVVSIITLLNNALSFHHLVSSKTMNTHLVAPVRDQCPHYSGISQCPLQRGTFIRRLKSIRKVSTTGGVLYSEVE